MRSLCSWLLVISCWLLVVGNQIYWKKSWHGSVAGIYHPEKGVIEWRETWRHGIACVYNPKTQIVEWKENWHNGVGGIYNPKTKQVEWKTAWKTGVVAISTFENHYTSSSYSYPGIYE